MELLRMGCGCVVLTEGKEDEDRGWLLFDCEESESCLSDVKMRRFSVSNRTVAASVSLRGAREIFEELAALVADGESHQELIRIVSRGITRRHPRRLDLHQEENDA